MYRAAQAASHRADEALADADNLVSPQVLHGEHLRHPSVRARTEQLVDRKLSCVGCQKQISRPCWYCIECDGTFRYILRESALTYSTGRRMLYLP